MEDMKETVIPRYQEILTTKTKLKVKRRNFIHALPHPLTIFDDCDCDCFDYNDNNKECLDEHFLVARVGLTGVMEHLTS